MLILELKQPNVVSNENLNIRQVETVMPLSLEQVESALRSEEAAEEVLTYVNSQVDDWLADQVFDDKEKAELYDLEGVLSQALSGVFADFAGDVEAAGEKHAGLGAVALSWLTIGGWVWALDISANPPQAGVQAQRLIDSATFRQLFAFAFPYVPIADFILPHSLALVISLTYPRSKDWLNAAEPLKNIHPDYYQAVNAKLREIGEAKAFEKRPDMSATLEGWETSEDRGTRKYYKKYLKDLSVQFRDQKYLGDRAVQDDNGVSVVIFGHKSLAICPERGKPVELNASEIRGISIGSLSQRMHTGYSYTDYEYWTIDIFSHSGAQWRVKALISVDNQDGNPNREALTRLFASVSDFYQVVSSGRHAVSNTGYRTRVSYGVWF